MSATLKLPHCSLKASCWSSKDATRQCKNSHSGRRCTTSALVTAGPESATEQAATNSEEVKPPAKKLCTSCRQVKGYEHFPRHGRSKDGLQSWCMECKIEEMRSMLPGQPATNEKRCRTCGELKPLSEYTKNRATPMGVDRNCRVCTLTLMREKMEANQQKHRKLGRPSVEGKACASCRVYKPATDFHLSLSDSTGLFSRCKQCMGVSVPRARPDLSQRENIAVEEKYCKKCGLVQPASYFALSRASSDGLQSYCRECFKNIGLRRLRNKKDP